MINRRRILFAAASVFALAPVFLTRRVYADDPATGAGKFIEALADKAVAALTERDIARAERVRRFRAMLHENFAVATIARWVLGRHWNSATEEQRKEYLGLFEDLIVLTYVDRFTEYSGEKLTVVKSLAAENRDVLVYSVINRPNQPEPLEVEWRVRLYGGAFKIIDVMVKGVSMGLTQRQEFASVFSRNGGSMPDFLTELRQRVKGGA